MADSANAMTERLLVDAGINLGMRVLDIGCGGGEVSFLLAKLVGKSGQVIGMDKNMRSLAEARERVQDKNLHNVTFLQNDLSEPLADLDPFDAAVGRRILMYLANPVDTIRHIAAAVRIGGILAFQESDSTMVPGRLAPLPLHDQVNDWIWKTVEREGANSHMGFCLPSLLEQAGLVVEHIRAEAVIPGQNGCYRLSNIIRNMLPRILKHGIAGEKEIDIETLEQRLSAEQTAVNAVYVSDMAFGTWARKS